MKLEELRSSRTWESLLFDLDNGGTVVSLVLGRGRKQILRNDSRDEYEDNPRFRGRFLFPFNDRIPGGRYRFRGREYHLPINNSGDGSAIHGFMYNKRVRLLSLEESKASVFWSTEGGRIPGYPFNISLTIGYSMSPGKLNIDFTVRNEGNTAAPFALGWHSYFPAVSGSRVYADFPCFFNIDNSSLPVGDCIPAEGTGFDFSAGRLLEDKTLDHTFASSGERGLILDNIDYKVKIHQENFAYTQLFIPSEGDSIAIEPITSKPNSFNSKEVMTISPGNVYTASVRIES